jgi:hypothetical protein
MGFFKESYDIETQTLLIMWFSVEKIEFRISSRSEREKIKALNVRKLHGCNFVE